MRILISGKNLEISSYLQEVVEKKMHKLDRFFAPEAEANVTLSVEKNRHIAEITIPHNGRIIRSEEVSGDMYASISAALDKLEEQIQRHKRSLRKGLREEVFQEFADYADEEDAGPRIVRVKRFDIKPMDEEEAALQLQLLGHSFYVFENARTAKMNVIYARKDGNFGLIEPN
ncbi:MAG: ribosome-associated translation inhibitor RaiA [Clostridiales bacterium]|nr:ribosome-associated translation inhibitor RaiA [Clostridiales bacterium]